MATTPNQIISSGSTAVISSGEVAGNNTVLAGGSLSILSGGKLSGGAVQKGGTATLASGAIIVGQPSLTGSLTGGTVSGGFCVLQVGLGGVASNVAAEAQGGVYVRSGGTARNTQLMSGGTMIVYDAGSAVSSYVAASGTSLVNSGGMVSASIVDGGRQFVYSGAKSIGTTIRANGLERVSSGGASINAVVSAGGTSHITSGATALNLTMSSGGIANIADDGTVSGANVKAGGLIDGTGASIFTGQIVNAGTIADGTYLSANVQNGGGTLSGIITVSSSLIVGGSLSGADTVMTVGSGGTLQDQTSYSSRVVSAGGVVRTGTVATGAVDTILAGGSSFQGVIAAGGERIVASGGIATETSIANGGKQTVQAGGTMASGYIAAGGNVVAEPGATLTGTLNNNGTLSGGTFTAATVSNGTGGTLAGTITADGTTVIRGGTIATDAVVNMQGGAAFSGVIRNDGTISGGNLLGADSILTVASGGVVAHQNSYGNRVVSAGGVIRNGTVNSGAVDTILAGGSSYQGVISAGGERIVSSGGVASNPVVANGGKVTIASGGTLNGVTVYAGGSVVAASDVEFLSLITNSGSISGGTLTGASASELLANGASHTDATIVNGAKMTVSSGGTLGGVTTVGANGQLTLAGATVTGSIVLDGTDTLGANLTIADMPLPGYSITGFGPGDKVSLTGLVRADIAKVSFTNGGNTVVFTMKDGSSQVLYLEGAEAAGYKLDADANGNLVYQTCFLAGTMIETDRGPVAVEAIRTGQKLRVFEDEDRYREVVWTGHNEVVVQKHLPLALAGYPVRIRKDALSAGSPSEDLLVTPEHCLYLDGAFIPARMLVNHQSIHYDTDIETYTYYHVEASAHSIISANNTLTESYLDTGNRDKFALQGDEAASYKPALSWERDAAAPLDVRREKVEPIFRALTARAATMGFPALPAGRTTGESALVLRNDAGQVFHPIRKTEKLAVFSLPAGCGRLMLDSRIFVPAEDIGPFVDDRRQLGVLVGAITTFHEETMLRHDMHLHDETLSGWEAVECAACRWTKGVARLPEMLTAHANSFILSVEIVAAGTYRLENDIVPSTLSA